MGWFKFFVDILYCSHFFFKVCQTLAPTFGVVFCNLVLKIGFVGQTFPTEGFCLAIDWHSQSIIFESSESLL